MMRATAGARPRTSADLFEFRTAVAEVSPSLAGPVAELAEQVARHARRHEPGTRLFTVLRDRNRPNRFLFAAVFDDTDAERLHRASPPAMRLAALLLSVGVRLEPSGWEPVAGL